MPLYQLSHHSLTTCYERTPITCKGLVKQQSFHAQTKLLNSIKHPIYDHSGHGNIKPDRKGPAGDASVQVEAFFKGSKERNQSQRDNRRCQNSVSQKNGEIDEPYPALPFERNGTHLVMVDEIRNKKEDRACEGSEHARSVRLDVPRLNEKKSRNQENGAE